MRAGSLRRAPQARSHGSLVDGLKYESGFCLPPARSQVTLVLLVFMVCAGISPSTIPGLNHAMQPCVDLLAVASIAINSLHEPYRARAQVIKRLRRDGMAIYLVSIYEF